jgi:riboflavin kinase / FMN adenylyltransferase
MASHILDWREAPPESCTRGVVAIGNFDGVHTGHAALVAELRARARALGGPAVAVTFDPHPHQLLRPGQAPPLLTTVEDRVRLLGGLGVEEVVVLRTTPDLLALAPAEFFEAVVQQRLGARGLVEGSNFRFGRNREGDVATLAGLCRAAGLPLAVVAPQRVDGVEVSSSRIRAALARGDVAGSAVLLGRPYRARGVVGVGQRRGQKLGFPTANLERVATVLPADGVYAVRGFAEGGAWPGAANVGPNPTFGESARKVEVHLIGFRGDLYGKELAVDFLKRLRDTRPFAGVEELVEQLGRDVEEAARCAAMTTAEIPMTKDQ